MHPSLSARYQQVGRQAGFTFRGFQSTCMIQIGNSLKIYIVQRIFITSIAVVLFVKFCDPNSKAIQECFYNFHYDMKYRKSSKETRGSYSFSEGPNAGLIRVWPQFLHFCLQFLKFSAGLIRMRVLFEGGSLLRIYGTYSGLSNKRAAQFILF